MIAAAILNFGQTTFFGHAIYFLVVYCAFTAKFERYTPILGEVIAILPV